MDAVEDAVEEKRDDSRPFFVRNAGEVGIYLDIYDATPTNPKAYGSQHYFIMCLMDKLYEAFSSQDLIKVKGRMEKYDVLQGVVLERFMKGIILGVSFNNEQSLDDLVNLNDSDKLTPIFQNVFITQNILTSCDATQIFLRAKVWDDEVLVCRQEIRSRSKDIVSLEHFERDLELLRNVRAYQRKLVDEIVKLREIETKVEQSLGEIIQMVKYVLPPKFTSIQTLRDFMKFAKSAMGRPGADKTTIKTYIGMLESGRKLFDEVNRCICHPLAQIHGVCEKEKQKKLKLDIKNKCKFMRSLIHKDADVSCVVYQEWSGKILTKEQPIFMGPISLVPMIVDGILEIDHITDEYISQFPQSV